MEINKIKSLLISTLSLQEVHVIGDVKHLQLIAVGKVFEQRSRLKRQQIVYGPLMDLIADNRIHAISIKTYTPDEWEKISTDIL